MKTTKIYLILIMILLMSSCVLATTTITDIKIEGLQYINATDNICVSNPNLCLINAIMSSWINITYDYELDNGTIIRSWNTTFVTDNAYNTEGELTALLDDNYIAVGTKLGNTSTEVADMLSNTTIVRASNTSWVTDLVTGADNESFNQSHTDTLYQPLGSYYTQAQIDNTTIVRASNTSWITDNQNNLYNNSGDIFAVIDNLTYIKYKWLENGTILTKANMSQFDSDATDDVLTSYSNVTYDDEADGKYCQSDWTNLTFDAELQNETIVRSYNTSWATDLVTVILLQGLGFNITTDLEARFNTLYADISVTGDNTTWNQLIANNLYIAEGTKLGNTTAEINTAEIDADHDECSEISGCIENAITNIDGLDIVNQTMLENNTIVRSSNTSWITDNQITYTSDNTTWNQLIANGLYAAIGVTGDNTTWSQLVANELYIAEGTKLGNTTAEIQAKVVQDNTTWNQIVANNLYADISVVDTTIGNCSSAYSCDVVVYSDNTSWITDNQLTYTSDNATWNQLVANGLYADISVSGDNTSWSQLVAEGLFPQTSWTNLTFDAEADGKYVQTSYSNVTYEDELVTYITTSNSTWITENQNNLYNTSSEIFDAVNNTELHTTLHCFNDACTHYINDTCHVYPSGGKSCTGS